jgi:hypothetical protein
MYNHPAVRRPEKQALSVTGVAPDSRFALDVRGQIRMMPAHLSKEKKACS